MLGVTGFFPRDYLYESGNVWTVEGSFTQNLPKFMVFGREWSPSISSFFPGVRESPLRVMCGRRPCVKC
jgi:hypothetical protein